MNIVFFAIVLIAFFTAGWHQLRWVPIEGKLSPMETLSKGMVDSAGGSVEFCTAGNRLERSGQAF